MFVPYNFPLNHEKLFDPRGRPTVTTGSDHCFRTWCPLVRPSVRASPLFKTKQISSETMFATGETVGLAEWIIDDSCLVFHKNIM